MLEQPVIDYTDKSTSYFEDIISLYFFLLID